MTKKITGRDSAAYRTSFDDPAAEDRELKRQAEIRRQEQRRIANEAKHDVLNRKPDHLPK